MFLVAEKMNTFKAIFLPPAGNLHLPKGFTNIWYGDGDSVAICARSKRVLCTKIHWNSIHCTTMWQDVFHVCTLGHSSMLAFAIALQSWVELPVHFSDPILEAWIRERPIWIVLTSNDEAKSVWSSLVVWECIFIILYKIWSFKTYNISSIRFDGIISYWLRVIETYCVKPLWHGPRPLLLQRKLVALKSRP